MCIATRRYDSSLCCGDSFGEMDWATTSRSALQHGFLFLACVLSRSFGEMDWATCESALQHGWLFFVCLLSRFFGERDWLSYFWTCIAAKVVFGLCCGESLRETYGLKGCIITTRVVSCLWCWDYLEKCNELLLHCKGCFMLVLLISLEKWIELLLSMHCAKDCFWFGLWRILLRIALIFFQMCNCNKVVSCLCCQVPLGKWIELFCNMYCNKGHFWLALWRILWRKELSYFGMCIATKFFLCLCCQGSSEKWVTIECALQNGLFLAWVIETIQRSGLSYFWICIAIRVVCCLSWQKKCLKSIVKHFFRVQHFFC